jgi:hypothetical protein
MCRSIFSGVIAAAVLLAAGFFSQASFGQDPWNHGFGSRSYGYSGDIYARGYASSSRHGDPGRYSSNYHRQQNCYPNRSYSLGGYSTGAYGYSTAPMYYGYNSYYAPYGYSGIGAVPPTSPYYQPLGVHRHGNTLYAPIPGGRAW